MGTRTKSKVPTRTLWQARMATHAREREGETAREQLCESMRKHATRDLENETKEALEKTKAIHLDPER